MLRKPIKEEFCVDFSEMFQSATGRCYSIAIARGQGKELAAELCGIQEDTCLISRTIKEGGERRGHGDRGQMINSLTLRWLTFLPSDAIHWQYFKMTDSGPCVKRYIIDLPFNPVRSAFPGNTLAHACMRAHTGGSPKGSHISVIFTRRQ